MLQGMLCLQGYVGDSSGSYMHIAWHIVVGGLVVVP
jgi:hypothetical protein